MFRINWYYSYSSLVFSSRMQLLLIIPQGMTILTETITSKHNKNPRISDFLSIELRKRKRKKNSGILNYFRSVACCCGLCVPNMIIAKANAKEIWGELFAFPFRRRMRKQISRFLFVIIFVWIVTRISAITVT